VANSPQSRKVYGFSVLCTWSVMDGAVLQMQQLVRISLSLQLVTVTPLDFAELELGIAIERMHNVLLIPKAPRARFSRRLTSRFCQRA
jgi:hypothetical protein